MSITLKNMLPDSTVVVAYTHIPPGQTRVVVRRHFDKWCKDGGYRIVEAGMIVQVHDEAEVAPQEPESPAAEVDTLPVVEETVPEAVEEAPVVEDAAPVEFVEEAGEDVVTEDGTPTEETDEAPRRGRKSR